VWTIGYGTTRYHNGERVKKGDKITQNQALDYLNTEVDHIAKRVDALILPAVNERQMNALISFAYNVGTEALRKSTLLNKVNKDPNDLAIRQEFSRWNKANGKTLKGLTERRKLEANEYFSTN
jgi:lysozyme